MRCRLIEITNVERNTVIARHHEFSSQINSILLLVSIVIKLGDVYGQCNKIQHKVTPLSKIKMLVLYSKRLSVSL